MGPGMDAVAVTTAWEPPYRFAAESRDLGPNAPALATEWIVEARSGDTCVVRVVHSLFASNDDWDDQLAGFESGWPAFFRLLRLYLTHFRDQRCSNVPLMVVSFQPETQAWDALTGSLGLAGVATGGRWHTPAGAPPLGGLVERIGEGKHVYEVLLLDQPAPGMAFLNACTMGGGVYLAMNLYLYGDEGAAAAARDESLWHAWMNERFPTAGDASTAA
jgi:hypothetical protein